MGNATTGQPGSVSGADDHAAASRTAADGHDALQTLLNEARETAREQLNAAWQIEADKLQEQLATGWRGHLDRIFEERFAELAARIEQQFKAAVESRAAAASARTRSDIASRLNQASRRLTFFDSDADWSRAVVDATEGFCERAAIFVVNGRALRLQAGRGISSDIKIDNTPIESAPAFAGAMESQDPVVAVRTRGELSDPIAELVGEASDRRFYVFPIRNGGRVAAILYGDDGAGGEHGLLESSALELLATLASLGLQSEKAADKKADLVSIATAGPAAPSITSWFSLSKTDQELHLQAQRFARVQVAQMRLYKSQGVKEGRLKSDLYGALRQEIDSARDEFRAEFLSASPTMVDYIHVELVRTLANDDAELLGKDYPGPMA